MSVNSTQKSHEGRFHDPHLAEKHTEHRVILCPHAYQQRSSRLGPPNGVCLSLACGQLDKYSCHPPPSAVSVTPRQPQSKNIRWKIPEIKIHRFLTILSGMMKSWALNINHPSVQCLYTTCLSHLVAGSIIRWTAVVSGGRCPNNRHFI